MYLIFADRRGSFIFPSIFMIVIIGVPRGSATKGRKVEVSRKFFDSTGLLAGTSNEPLQHGIQIRLLFRAYPVAAHFPVGDAFEIQRFDQLVDG